MMNIRMNRSPKIGLYETMIFSTTDSTKAEKGISLRAQRFSPGWYLVEASTKDKYGEEIKQKQYIEIEDYLSRGSTFPKFLGYTDQPQTLQPGQTATIEFGSPADSIFVIRQINRQKSCLFLFQAESY